MVRRPIALLLGSILLATACSGDDDGSAPARNRLAVIDGAGDLVVMAPDGSDVVTVADEPEDAVLTQPVWSPDGRWLAWSEFAFAPGTPNQVGVVEPGEAALERFAVPFGAFYTLWDPTSSRVAVLGNGPAGEVALAVVDPTSSADATILDAGLPYYLSWNPAGDRLVTHVGNELATLLLDGSATAVGDVGTAFRAPIWLPGSDDIVFADTAGPGATAFVLDLASDDRRALVAFDGLGFLVASPDGDRLFLSVVGSAADDETITIGSTTDDPLGPGTYVVDVATGAVIVLDDSRPRLAAFWNPVDASVLTLGFGDTAPFVRWEVWDGGDRRFHSDPFLVSPTLATRYLPFYDQLAQSIQLWSPDGGSFVYAGTSAGGATGVWVQRLDGEAPALVSTGELGIWSPT